MRSVWLCLRASWREPRGTHHTKAMGTELFPLVLVRAVIRVRRCLAA